MAETDQSFVKNNLQSQKDFNQQTLFPHQPNRSQSFLDAHMENQRHEIDQFIRLQRKQRMEMILSKMETKALVLMTQKEEEMSKALSKNMELEDLLRKMEMENQTWQRMARENE
uniref:BOI-related E3 ubiquitin-protein ligase 2 n=2 Tax=Noccaea caerulescens TaxID=107243 RepID=A0A1J3J761_NOCCA